jgi:hypothetical protein
MTQLNLLELQFQTLACLQHRNMIILYVCQSYLKQLRVRSHTYIHTYIHISLHPFAFRTFSSKLKELLNFCFFSRFFRSGGYENSIFWVITPCSPLKNQPTFRGNMSPPYSGRKNIAFLFGFVARNSFSQYCFVFRYPPA